MWKTCSHIVNIETGTTNHIRMYDKARIGFPPLPRSPTPTTPTISAMQVITTRLVEEKNLSICTSIRPRPSSAIEVVARSAR